MIKLARACLVLIVIFATLETAAVEIQKTGVRVKETEITPDSLLQVADATFQKRDYKAALEQYQKALEAARTEFNRSIEIEAASQAARMHLILGDLETGLKILADVETRASDSDPMGWSRYLSVKGRYEWKSDQLTTAALTFEQMYDYCQINGLWGRAVDAANMMAIVSDDPQVQIEWGRKGIQMAEESDSESWLGPLWNNLAGVYYDLEQFDSSLECYHKAREYHWRHSGEISKLFADYHVGMTYRYLKQYEEAKKWLRPVLAWAERIEAHSAIGQALEDLGEIEIAQGKLAEGIKLLKRARKEYRAEGFDTGWPEIWNNINNRLAKLTKP